MICLDKTCLIDLDVFLSISLSFYWSTNYSLFLFLATRVFVNDKQESNGTHVKNNLFFFFFCRSSNQPQHFLSNNYKSIVLNQYLNEKLLCPLQTHITNI